MNVGSAQVHDRYFFLHLQKTAGTALWQRLREAFPAEQLYPGPGDGDPPASTLEVDHLLQRWAARSQQIRVVTGHFPLCTTQLLGGGFTTFTVLREPVERVQSALRDIQQRSSDLAGLPMDEIYEDPLRRLMLDNHMTKMLSLTVDEMTGGAMTDITITDDHVQRAKSALVSIDVVGLQSRFDEFCTTLGERFGWSLGAPRFANRSRPVETDQLLYAQIAAHNAADLELYEFAEGLIT